MAVVPAVPTVTSASVYTSSQLSQMAQVETFLLGTGAGSSSAVRPIAEVYSNVAQTIPTAAFTSVLFELSVVDSVNGHSNTTNTSRYTAVYAGWYSMAGAVTFSASATGSRGARLAVNGTGLNYTAVLLPNNGGAAVISADVGRHHVYLNVGDYAELQGYQDTGSGLTTAVGAGWQPFFSVLWESN